MKNGFVLLKANWALVIRSEIIISLLYLLFIPVIRGVANLDAFHTAECLEQTISVIGIFLLVPLTAPEQSKETQEIIFSKPKSYVIILFVRLVMASLLLLLLVGGFALVMLALQCTFPFVPYIGGTYSTALVLGGCGLLATSLLNNQIAGYFLSAGYYLLNLLGGINANSRLFLFSMSEGDMETKGTLAIIGMACILIVLFFQRIRRR